MQIIPNSPLAAMPAAQQSFGPSSASDADSSSSSSSTNSATVSANDFLQLLVTEMKNQDPTANTDPNQYINQLVQVNSLEQLIQINQDLTPSSSPTNGNGGAAGAATGQAAGAAQGHTSTGSATGNLSAPVSDAAATRVASALQSAAQTLAPGAQASPLDAVLHSIRTKTQQAQPIATSTPAR